MPIILLLWKGLVIFFFFFGLPYLQHIWEHFAWKQLTTAHDWRPEINLDLGNHIIECSKWQFTQYNLQKSLTLACRGPRTLVKGSYCLSRSTAWLSPDDFVGAVQTKDSLSVAKTYKNALKLPWFLSQPLPKSLHSTPVAYNLDSNILSFSPFVANGFMNRKVTHLGALKLEWYANHIGLLESRFFGGPVF